MTAQEPRPSPQRDGEKPPLPPPPPPRKDRGSWEDLAYALQIAKAEIERLREEVARLSAELTSARRRIELAGGYHARTEREIEIANALAQVEPDDRDPPDIAIAELLELVDAGRNRVHEEIERREEAEAERDALQKFKKYVHKRLDTAGVPVDPDPEETARTGCRIGRRLDCLILAWNRLAAETGFPNPSGEQPSTEETQ